MDQNAEPGPLDRAAPVLARDAAAAPLLAGDPAGQEESLSRTEAIVRQVVDLNNTLDSCFTMIAGEPCPEIPEVPDEQPVGGLRGSVRALDDQVSMAIHRAECIRTAIRDGL